MSGLETDQMYSYSSWAHTGLVNSNTFINSVLINSLIDNFLTTDKS